jgi:ubiquinone biosynthesis protein Coq4
MVITHFKKLRAALLVTLTHKIALPVLKIFRNTSAFPYDMQQLAAMPAGSLGNDLFIFLQQRKLSLLKYYVRHDLKHIVLQYDTTDEGEACLQIFMLGNGRVSFPVLATVVYSVVTMPEYWHKMQQAFANGRNANKVHDLPLSALLLENTDAIRSKIFKN